MAICEWRLEPWSSHKTLYQVTVDSTLIRGSRSAFGPELMIPYTVKDIGMQSQMHGRFSGLVSLSGWIALASEAQGAMGIPIPAQVVAANHTFLHVPVTDVHLLAIEEARNGGAVNLLVRLSGLASVPDPNFGAAGGLPGAVAQTDHRPVCEVREVYQYTGMDGTRVEIPREQWLTVLEQTGFGKRRLVELPEPRLPRGDPHWVEALRHLDQGTHQFRMGQYELGAAECRVAVEACLHALADHFQVPRTRQTREGKMVSLKVEEYARVLGERLDAAWGSGDNAGGTLAALLSAAWTWASPQHHAGTGIAQRDEAAFALGLTADLLFYAALVIKGHQTPVGTSAS